MNLSTIYYYIHAWINFRFNSPIIQLVLLKTKMLNLIYSYIAKFRSQLSKFFNVSAHYEQTCLVILVVYYIFHTRLETLLVQPNPITFSCHSKKISRMHRIFSFNLLYIIINLHLLTCQYSRRDFWFTISQLNFGSCNSPFHLYVQQLLLIVSELAPPYTAIHTFLCRMRDCPQN